MVIDDQRTIIEQEKDWAYARIAQDFSIVATPSEIPKLYHYTNAQGFKGIIESKALHLSDVLFMNDRDELKHSINIMKMLLKEAAFDADECDRELVYCYTNALVERFLNGSGQMKFFVSSFSQDRDQLSQWRGYGGGRNGYALTFDFSRSFLQRDNLTMGLPFHSNDRIIYLIKVSYDLQSKQLPCIKSLLQNSCTFLRQLRSRGIQNENHLLQLLGELADDLVLNCLLKFKNSAYETEAEWRVVEARRQSSIPGMATYYGDGVQFKVSNNALIPFVVLEAIVPNLDPKYHHHKTGVSEILIGPREEIDIYIEPTRLFLEYNQCKTPISVSSVPIRY